MHARTATGVSSLSLHDALPIYRDVVTDDPNAAENLRRHRQEVSGVVRGCLIHDVVGQVHAELIAENRDHRAVRRGQDRKSTRLNSSHPSISYAVFCLKKKMETEARDEMRDLRLVGDYSMPNGSDKVVRIIHSYTDYVNRVLWKK